MRLLVCGNRTCVGEAWELTIASWLGAIGRTARRRRFSVTLIHGAAPGADSIAAEVGKRLGWEVLPFPADWDAAERRGNRGSAGPIRNQQMLIEGQPTRALAFGSLEKPKSDADSGTGDMVKRLNRAGILVTVVPKPGALP